ncbi:MAG: DUF1398 family protein [Rickettsiales bacterium]|nr:DUF1398 family protein [Pseudomonadota bacterium]MDA0965974.1 DUF1398 family protein [Pseudomonadota bacterium]MDG4542555.1 DUF1398 family protein [Rickettsiales bacterium]MDG4545059.1 DUF1398 family protein [Rickettsiales bacterium]MDG4547182.1 DUF1398 family protein [Rickettsiales bacterium]
MKTDAIKECTSQSLAEQITFPEVVMKLAEAGVERYIADLVGKKKFSFGKRGETHTGELNFNSVDIPEQLDAVAVKQTITDIQQGKIKYQTFLRRIMEAGCTHYEVFISGGKAVYFGRDGNQHIELFPKAA